MRENGLKADRRLDELLHKVRAVLIQEREQANDVGRQQGFFPFLEDFAFDLRDCFFPGLGEGKVLSFLSNSLIL